KAGISVWYRHGARRNEQSTPGFNQWSFQRGIAGMVRSPFVVGLLLLAPGGFVRSEENAAPAVEALRSALVKNIEHSRDWLAAKDFKSLGQSAGGLELLAEVLRAKSDDAAWQAATGQVLAAAKEVRAAAQAEDGPRSAEALAALEKKAADAAGISPAGQPLPPPRANLRSLMLLMDGVYADGKIALLTDQPQFAKNQAQVLSELGRVVSNSRSGDRWAGLSDGFVQAAQNAAQSSEADAQALRPLMRAISQRCEACHDTR
ncbi:MAG TPA: hypothetical protein VFV87_01380, partial [Pirellulaceae bacterium]|nr:hypothetical protein [Pirellulaceae bacterium]